MHFKKSLMILLGIILVSHLVLAQGYKLTIEVPEKTFEAGEDISFKVVLRDSENKLIRDDVFVTLEDSEKSVKIEKTVFSNEFASANLGENARYGPGLITAKYQGVEANALFDIGINELAKFKLENEKLIITNVGNTKYSKTVNIIIGDTAGKKYPKLNVGESVSYRLIAPEGVYAIRIYDDKTTLTQEEVRLTGTGNVIGAIDESSSSTGITVGIRDEDSYDNLYGNLKQSKFTYVFVLVIFGAMILLAVERNFRKKAS